MSIFYLISIIFGISFQNIIKKPFTEKHSGKGLYFFSLLVGFSAMIFFALTSKKFEWNSGLIVYAVFFALAYTTATVCSLYAVACGSLSLTALVVSYSLILPTVYGLIFLKDPLSFSMIVGFILLVISIFLINKTDEEKNISFKWIVFAILAFVGNGMASVIQKMQQIAFDGSYKNEFMIIALLFVVLFLSVFVLKKERKEIKTYAKSGWYLAISCGIANGIVNLFVMILSAIMPVSLMFPMISAGGIIVTYIVSRFFYKEKLTKIQFAGFLIGIVSVVFLS